MQKLYFMFFLTIVFLFASCSNESEGLTEPPSGIYSYTSFDSSGTPIVEGILTMTINNSQQIIGKWDFELIGNPQNIGPQEGKGDLLGSVEQDRIWVELNPQFRDNNLQLLGTIKNNKFSGTWGWSSILGLTNHGTFEAIKVRF